MYYIGVDIGGTGIKAGIVDERGTILIKDSVPTEKGIDYKGLAKSIYNLIQTVLKKSDTDLANIKSIGMGCPGTIDAKNGTVVYANNINLTNAPICEELKKHIDKPIYIDNDANCAALGEYFALGDDSISDFVAITLGTGIGGGVVINKKLYSGFKGAGAELGHMVIDKGGEPCSCGRKGCWEAYASATALIRETKKAAEKESMSYIAKLIEENGGDANGKMVWDACEAGDKIAQNVIDQYIENLSEGLANIINSLRPEIIVIGGGVCRQGDNLLKPLKNALKGKIYGGDLTESSKIEIAKLGNDAGIIGAAFLGK